MDRIQYLIIGISAVIFLWFLIPLVTKGIFSIGNATGMVVFGALAAYGFFMKECHQFIAACTQKTGGKVFLGIVAVLAAVTVILAVAETVCMVRAAVNEPKEETTVIVLGCSVKGSRPSKVLAERLDAAYEYLAANSEVSAILSGGQGKGEDISEAQCMYEYLTAKGIEGERLFLEDASTSTEENLRFSLELIEENGLNRAVTIITSEFHQYRASVIAKELGLTSYSVSSHTYLPVLPTYYVRELYAILEQWILK